MKKISFNEGTLTFDKNIVTYEVPLEKTYITDLEEIQSVKYVPFMFPIINLDLIENNSFLLMQMEVENGFLPLTAFKMNSEIEEKNKFIKQLCEVAVQLQSNESIVTVFDHINVLYNPQKEEIKMLYRGINGLMRASTYTEEDIVTQLKRLALFILTTSRYDELRVNGLHIALNKVSQDRYKLVSKIYQAKTIIEMLAIFDEYELSIKTERQDQENEERSNNKSGLFRIPSIKKQKSNEQDVVVQKSELSIDAKPESKGNKIDAIEQSRGKVDFVKEMSIKEVKKTDTRNEPKQRVNKKFSTESKLKIASIAVVSVFTIAFVTNIIGGATGGKQASVINTEEQSSSESDETLLLKGLQYAAVQDYETASNNFETLKTPFESLSEENQLAILFSYLMTGKYEKAIDAEPAFAYSIINYLVAEDDLSKVKEIKSSEPVIIFEKAALNKEFDKVLNFKDKVKLDGRRDSLVVDAFIGLNKLDEAYDFTKSKGNSELMTKVQNLKNAKREKEPNEGQETDPTESTEIAPA